MPQNGRFLNADIILYSNLYLYAENNPSNGIDINGKEATSAICAYVDVPPGEYLNVYTDADRKYCAVGIRLHRGDIVDVYNCADPDIRAIKISDKEYFVSGSYITYTKPVLAEDIFGNHLLKLEIKGAENELLVRNLQIALQHLNLYSGNINGLYDKNTKEAVIAFQKQYDSLSNDGMVGEKTREKLFEAIYKDLEIHYESNNEVTAVWK